MARWYEGAKRIRGESLSLGRLDVDRSDEGFGFGRPGFDVAFEGCGTTGECDERMNERKENNEH